MKNSSLKRAELKYIRDKAKALYEKGSECEICGVTTDLELHHFNTLSILWNVWKERKKIIIQSVADIINFREHFIAEHQKELYDDVVTLCKNCHNNKLHKVYGARPPLATAEKQKRWVLRQRLKKQES